MLLSPIATCYQFCSAPVFSGIVVDVEPSGYISFKMFAEKFQQKKFHTLSTVEEPGNKDSAFHEIVPRLRCQNGNFTCCNDNISKSIHREKFEDEHFILKHMVLGILFRTCRVSS